MSLDASKPFRVRTTEGVLRSQHNTLADAKGAAARANRDAERMAVEARYEAHDETAA